jgi:N-acetylneuraminate synthase
MNGGNGRAVPWLDVDAPCFIVAEVGVNHNGSAELARDLVLAAADTGADAVKFQTFRPEALVTGSAPRALYQQAADARPLSQRAMLEALTLADTEFGRLQALCVERGLGFLSTPFDSQSLQLLVELGVPQIKIGSGDLTNLPFLCEVGATGLPVILSTGMSAMDEVADAVTALRRSGCQSLALLHCVSCYPAAVSDANLRAMDTLAARFRVPVGFSDHTPGQDTAVAAVARGARILEKHLTLDHGLPGPDHRASLEPAAFAALVTSVRKVESALGTGIKEPVAAEAEVRAVARRSLVAGRDLPAGSLIAVSDLAVKRPGTGLPPGSMDRVVGRRLRIDVRRDTLLSLEMLDP